MSEITQGIIVYRASRVEALLDPLRTLLRAAPPAHVLSPHELIAAHPGMRQWLGRELAVREGPRGIAANLRIDLPSTWLDRLAREVLGEEAIALRPYRSELLRWRIHELLGDLDDATLAAYLDGDANARERRRFQLAERLARLYSRYLVYRPDWLRDWAEGRNGSVAGGLLAQVWKTLRAAIGVAHRGERIAQLLAALDRPPAIAREPLHVFGIAHLAPTELAVLQAVSRQRVVALYVPDPCRVYWSMLRHERSILREQVERDPTGESTELAFLEMGHPLLAAWGRMGQHFMLALDGIGADLDTRHYRDEDEQAPTTRLQGVQESIRNLKPELMGEYARRPREDASLRVHACHTRLRELEVLRDALLAARSERPDLKPSDMVVMMPDIHAYLPLLPAVFGEAGRHQGPLPYHCADVAVSRTHPLFEAFRCLLDLPQSRLTALELSDWLAMPPVAARLQLDDGDVEVLTHWLGQSRAAWALDGQFRARFDVPAIREYTHAWAVERLLAGYVFGHDDEVRVVTLPDGTQIAPLGGAQGPDADLLGVLDHLLVLLGEACADGGLTLPASAWAERLEQRIEALFRIAPDDAQGRDAWATLLQAVRALASEPGDSGLDPQLGFDVVRECLLAQLDGVPERQRFLLGGVTFCGMVPQRAIPFAMVAVLGLDEGAFPRSSHDGGLDLMRLHPRMGDREVRSDDRYLFLETLMSARWRLHLSYIGEGVQDGRPRNPAAPLAELMAALDAAAGWDEPAALVGNGHENAQRLRPWWVRHPLQPFDARYFDGSDVALHSYRQAFAGMQRTPEAAGERPFVPALGERLVASTPAPASIALSSLLDYFRDPARQLLKDALHLRLDALEASRLRSSEPLDGTLQAIDRLGARLFIEGAARGEHELALTPPDWLRLTGMLAPGRAGDAAWQNLRDQVGKMFVAVAAPDHTAHALFQTALPPGNSLEVECDLGAHRLHGVLHDIYSSGQTRWLLDVRPGKSESALDFRVRIGLFLRWAVLRLISPPQQAVRVALITGGKEGWSRDFNAWDAAWQAADAATQARQRHDLQQRMTALIEFFLQSQQRPQWYFPATSWAARDDDPTKAAATWLNDRGTGERDHAPGYARLLAGGCRFDGGDEYAQLRAHADHLRALIDLGASPERAA